MAETSGGNLDLEEITLPLLKWIGFYTGNANKSGYSGCFPYHDIG